MKIVFTNGCFDILHAGHVSLLEYARSLGDQLVVGLNSDDSVRKLKGNKRPINNQEDRKKILESIKWVDKVIIFEEDTPINLINDLRPSIIVKGGDYAPQEVVGFHLEQQGISKVVIFPTLPGRSTSLIIEKTKNDLCS